MFIDDNVIIPDEIKKMSAEELKKAIQELGVVWKIAMFGKMHRNYCMLGENPQAGCRLTRIFDDTDSDLWAFWQMYGFFKQALEQELKERKQVS